jgi:hypothetical protein
MSIKIMVENLLLVSWWGVSIRYPRLAKTFRASPADQYLSDLATRLS